MLYYEDDLDEKHKSLKNSLETLATEIAELQKEEEDMKIALKQAPPLSGFLLRATNPRLAR